MSLASGKMAEFASAKCRSSVSRMGWRRNLRAAKTDAMRRNFPPWPRPANH